MKQTIHIGLIITIVFYCLPIVAQKNGNAFKSIDLIYISHQCKLNNNLIEDGGFERASNAFELEYSGTKDKPKYIVKDTSNHIWVCSPDTFWNSFTKTNSPLSPMFTTVMKTPIDTLKYGRRVAYNINWIANEKYKDSKNYLFYKYCKLTKSIKKGELVKAGFEYLYARINTDQIIFNSGLLFTNKIPDINNKDFAQSTPQILNKAHITTRGNWYAVKDSFIAESDLNWVTIGVFANHKDWVIDRTNMKIYDTPKYEEEKAKNPYFMGVRVYYDNVFAEVSKTHKDNSTALSVYFDFANPNLSDDQIALLKEKLSLINTSKIKDIEVEAFTDEQGTQELNQALSNKRANYVKSLLMEILGSTIPINAVGKGKYVNDADEKDPSKQRMSTIMIYYK